MLWHCWLSGRKGIRPVKNWVVHGAGMVISLERVADLHMAQLMPLPLTVFCFSKIQIGFAYLVLANPGSPGKRPLNGCVCVCVCVVLETVNSAYIVLYCKNMLNKKSTSQLATCHCSPLLLTAMLLGAIAAPADGSDRRTDTVPSHRPCCSLYEQCK